jgi:hypothetical protein
VPPRSRDPIPECFRSFVVGRDGYVRARFIDPAYRKPMAIADMLRGAPKMNQFVKRDQSAARSNFRVADATAVRSRPATP